MCIYKCELCGESFESLRCMLKHVATEHRTKDKITSVEYYDTYLKKNNICEYCGEQIPFPKRFTGYCSVVHQKNGKLKEKGKLNHICSICGIGFIDIKGFARHISESHTELGIEGYYKKYIWKDGEPDGKCLWCGEDVGFNTMGKGYRKFCYNKDCNVKWHNKNTDRLEVSGKNISKSKQENPQNNPLRVDYYIHRGFSEDEAVLELKKRQSTFSKDICIEKHGEEEGLEIWKNRQGKWINSYPKQNYSNISQELYWELYNTIKYDYNDVYFAQLDPKTKKKVFNRNFEYRVETEKTYRKLDFYIKDINKCIEFDGTYWHGDVGRGNRTKDQDRDIEIISSTGMDIYHVKEADFKGDNKINIIRDCLKFLRE